jgi:hypothetical protein
MKALSCFAIFSPLLFFFTNVHSQTDIPGGEISGVWNLSGSPYRISDSITIPDDTTLSIEPGVTIEFQGHYSMFVQGNIQALGTETDSIFFTINDTTGFSDINISSGGWNGIRIIDTNAENDSTIFEYCVFQYGKAVASYWHENAGGALCIVQFDKVRISHSRFYYNSAGGSDVPSGGAIHLAWSDIHLNDNRFDHNRADAGGAIQMHESDPVFMRNVFINNSAREGGSISIGSLSNPTFSQDSILSNNALEFGGGIMCWDKSVLSFEDIYVRGNRARWGGGIGLAGIQASFSDCEIQENIATDLGGGIASDYSNVSLMNTMITSNSASMSGGIHAWYDTLEIDNGEVSGNSADYGGGLHSEFSQIRLINTRFIENTAINGGGLHIWNCDLDMQFCEFTANNVTTEGGAMEFNLGDTLVFDRPYIIEISESQFIENNADFRSAGIRIGQGDTVNSYADIFIDQCIFKKNHAERVSGLLITGIFKDFMLSNSKFSDNMTDRWNGGASFTQGCTGKVVNCEFTNNQASNGNPGASGTSNGSFVHYINCTFANNTAPRVGGLSAHRDGKATITNCVFWNNTPKQIAVTGIREGALSELYVNYCNIQYGEDSIEVDNLALLHWGIGNIDSDPLFYDPDNGDFHLLDDSPCIDAGIDSIEVNGEWVHAPLLDIEGYPRPQGGSTLFDMGAYENQDVLGHPESISEKTFHIKAYPNPFNSTTHFELNLKQKAWISIRVYSMLGEEVVGLVDQNVAPGIHRFSWNANGIKGGMYIYRISINEELISDKIFLLQ